MSKKSFIDSVEVKSPCTEDWEKMHGNDRVRFCGHCAKDVNNLSGMTRKQAMRLVRASGGNLCIRYVQNPVTKRPIFAEQLLQITRRTPRLAAGVVSASVSLSTLTYAQGGGVALRPVSEPVNECPDKVPIEAKNREPDQGIAVVPEDRRVTRGILGVSGTLTDYTGAVIPNMTVTITDTASNVSFSSTSNHDGFFEFTSVDPGQYDLVVPAQKGFMSKTLNNIRIHDRMMPMGDLMLDVGAIAGGAMISIDYAEPLHRAVANEDLDLVSELIAQGENVNGKDENYGKITPLFVAVEHGSIEIIRLLLDAGAKVNARDGERQTPLMQLDSDARPELVELLLRHGAKVNLTDNENNTALIFAADEAPAEVVRALIDAGADVNVVNKEGQTALMNAADDDSLEKVKMLVDAGAMVNLRNRDGETAVDLTSEEEIENLLVGYGAQAKVRPIETKIQPQEVPVPD